MVCLVGWFRCRDGMLEKNFKSTLIHDAVRSGSVSCFSYSHSRLFLDGVGWTIGPAVQVRSCSARNWESIPLIGVKNLNGLNIDHGIRKRRGTPMTLVSGSAP